jgi:hypothetical protein
MSYPEQSAVSWPSDSPDLVTAWLRGELVDRLGIGVDEGANVNASSSLSTRAPHDSRGHHGTANVRYTMRCALILRVGLRPVCAIVDLHG